MALIDPESDPFLLQVIRALGSYRTEVVLIGGCAKALYRYHTRRQLNHGESAGDL